MGDSKVTKRCAKCGAVMHNVSAARKYCDFCRFGYATNDPVLPLVHPKYIMENPVYDKQLWHIMGDSKRVAFARKIESIARQIAFGGREKIASMVKEIMGKFGGK